MQRFCWVCGNEVDSLEEPSVRVYCKECAKEKKELAKKEFNEYWRIKNRMTLERAIKRIEEDETEHDPIEEYREVIDAVDEYVQEHPRTLASTEEYITLIDLLRHRIKIKCQQKILGYKVDFLLPDLKIVLEIDGERHKGKRFEDSRRDLEILYALGADWEVIRVPTDLVNKYPKRIFKSIIEMKAEKQARRKESNTDEVRREMILSAELERQHREYNKKILKRINEESRWI